ncbi:B3 domain-containing transcription factor VRN1 [Quillaja saponaria]|uniref:B3 domain-containing transcription factor VRN1 n=1 Tax=Quillaja saponaria TaxID=32244 RepID=A0AAD7QJM8_QUISA|nr:B3 domain-containing transcription factor VRN1 [Quillaja saponaria]
MIKVPIKKRMRRRINISDIEDSHDTSNRSNLNEDLMSKRANPSFEVEFSQTCKHYVACSGWAAFKNDNNVKVGDVCDFELIKGKKIILH